ncbi:GlxA family transcriptional regulator [Herbaspirillum seropedicae]|uniref:GlxA family transcriptional regulator n=1 Tax=Herbaspirillum seropedicae TaxID=964 RepID=UPI000863AF86|nr:helix-turn-helix domain-containing protein [Herbaspirillum seropedicae]AON54697.1 AraC family transcriptional regulator [Herbaspirillum seropedicae]
MHSRQSKELNEDCSSVKHIGVIVSEGVILADLAEIAEVFFVADKMLSSMFSQGNGYHFSLLSVRGGMITTSSSVQIGTLSLQHHDIRAFDSIIIADGRGNFADCNDPQLLNWLATAALHAPRIAALCTGVLVLAEVGLLDGKKVAAHWALRDRLQREFPDIHVEPGDTLVQDQNVFTSADSGTGAEVALALIEDDLGSSFAHRIEQSLTVRQHHQFKHSLSRGSEIRPGEKRHRSERIQKALIWLDEHMSSSINMTEAADHVSMSERNFQREFKRETGETPHCFLTKIRIEAACLYLKETDLPIEKIARRCGLVSGEHLARLFRKHHGVSPGEYRKKENAPRPAPIVSVGSPLQVHRS